MNEDARRRALRAGFGVPTRIIRVTPAGAWLVTEWTVGLGPRSGAFELVKFATGCEPKETRR